MNPEEHLSDGRIRYRYPMPIAVSYRLSRIVRTPAVRAGHVLGCIDETVRFLCWVLLAEYLGSPERNDAAVETGLDMLGRPTTRGFADLLWKLVQVGAPEDWMVPNLVGLLRGPTGEALIALAHDSCEISIDRNGMDMEQMVAQVTELSSRLSQVLEGLSPLEELLVVRPEAVSGEDDGTCMLHMWRGVGGMRPLVVRTTAPLAGQADAALLLSADGTEGLWLSPFVVPNSQGRFLSFLEGDEERIRYEHYASGSVESRRVSWTGHLDDRSRFGGRVRLPLDAASQVRVQQEARECCRTFAGYQDAIPTAVTRHGEHFRAVHVSSGEIHDVVRMHSHLGRDEDYLRQVTHSARTLSHVRHPNIASPEHAEFDPATGCFIVGTPHVAHGRLIDRLPPGYQLPILWSLKAADAVLAGLDALAERSIFVSALPAWAISIGQEIQVVPFLAGTVGRAKDAPQYVGRLLYQMLTGGEPTEVNPLAPSLMRKGVPEPVDHVVLSALYGSYSTPLAMRADLRTASQGVEELGASIQNIALQRTFAHLQRLRPGMLESLDHEATQHEASGEWPLAMARLHDSIDALWDPDARLARVIRLVDAAGSQEDGRGEMLSLYQHLIDLAGDHMPTLRFVAATYRDAIRVSDRARLFQRILHAAHSEEERFRALADLAALCEERRELEQARAYWERLVDLRPDRVRGWYGLTRVCRILGDEAALARSLEKLLELVEGEDERLDLARELAVLRAGVLGDPRGAVDLLREVVEHPSSGSGAWEVLCEIARECHDDELLVDALEGLRGCSDLSEDEKHSVDLERAVVMGLRLRNVSAAVALLDAVLDKSPSHTIALSYKSRILESGGLWLDASAALERWAAVESDPWILGSVLRRLARLLHEHVGDADRAFDMYQGVLETNPTDREALLFLENVYTEREEWVSLGQVLASLAEQEASREGRQALLFRLGQLQEKQLADNQLAFHTYAKLLREDPRCAEVFPRFVELAEATDSWPDAGAIVNNVLLHMAPDEAQEWRLRLGQIQLDRAEDLTALVELFREAVREDPTDISSLEGLRGATARIGAWEEHCGTLESLVTHADGNDKRAALLHAIAETCRDRLLDPKRAADTYDRILALEPEDVGALAGACALGEVASRTARQRVRLLRRWVVLCPDPLDRLDALESIVNLAEPGGLTREEIAAHYEDILELDPANPRALAGLESYHRDRKDWERVVEVLEQRVETSGSLELPGALIRLAATLLDDLEDSGRAGSVIERLLEEHPDQSVDIDMVERVLTVNEQFERLMEYFAAQAEHALREEDRAEFLYRQGRVLADCLNREDDAIPLMERAVAQDTGHRSALAFLAEIYIRAEQWAEVLPILEALVGTLASETPPVAVELMSEVCCRLAEVRERLGDDDRAADAFRRVLELEPQSQRALQGLGRIAWRDRDYDAAEEYYRKVLEHHEEQLSSEDVAALHAGLGEIASAQGDDSQSKGLLEKALAANPQSVDTLRELAQICERQNDWAAAIDYRRRMAELNEDPLERFAALIEVAKSMRTRLEDDQGAREILEQARELRPDSVAVSLLLLDVYLAVGRYKQAVDVLQSLIAHETEAVRRAKYTYTLALLYRDNLLESRKAVAFLNETLDLDPGRLEAFEALDRLLVQHKDWQGQAKSYRAMLDRIDGTGRGQLEFRLLVNLARVMRDALDSPGEARELLERALMCQPDAFDVREQLAELYEAEDNGTERALEEYRGLLRVNPNHMPAWRALGRIFARERNRDAAWNVCGVLSLLNRADAKEKAFYRKHQRPALALRKALDGPEQWEGLLFDREEDRLLGQIFEVICGALGSKLALRSLDELGLSAADRISQKHQSRFTNFLGTVSKILRIPVPPVFRSARVRGVRKEPLNPPSMLVGPEVLTGRKGKELRFLIGKSMAYFLPAHLVAGMYPVGHLRTLLLAGLCSVLPDAVPGDEPGVRGVQKQLEQVMTRRSSERLTELCTELAGRSAGPNLNDWLKAVERTANHAGHLLCNDIEVSVRMLKEEREHGQRHSALSLREAIEDLARYTVSPEFLTLRREVGAAIVE